MNKKITKTILCLMTVFTMFFSTLVASADEAQTKNIGVGANPPSEEVTDNGNTITPFGLTEPNSQWSWSKGKYSFSGKAGNSPLYTNYYFKGKTKYIVSVTNNNSKKLTVNLRRIALFNPKVASFTVSGDSTYSKTISGLNKDHKYYLEFVAPSNFKGSIKP